MRATHSTPGLGTLEGIRWLLGVGALVTAVSVYRLVASQWASLSVVAQFLTLSVGSLSVFGAGELLRHRFRLPLAGAALGWLFAGLVPVLSWGAAYLDLLRTTPGALVVVVSMFTLLAAFRRCLKEAFRYDGLVYPAAFGLLTASLPLWSRFAPALDRTGLLLATLALGAVLHVGSRHINRFLFHRDRRDGIDRPLHALPFVALVLLYGASLSVLGLPGSYVALPLVVVGIVLVATGGEYYQALVRSLRARPSAWPGRSVALLALGFGLVAISGPLAFLDASGTIPALVFGLLAVTLFYWSFRYESSAAHVAAMLASVFGYSCLPAILPGLVNGALESFAFGLGLEGTFARVAFAHLGLAAVFTGLSRRSSRIHAIAATVHLVLVVGLSGIAGVSAAKIVAPLALGLALMSAWRRRRPEWLIAAHAALGASILAWGGAHGMEWLAIVSIAIVARSREKLAILPAFFWAVVIVLAGFAHFGSGGALEVLFAGALLLVLGGRLELPASVVAGMAALSLGIHGELAFTWEVSRSLLVLATLALFAISVVVAGRSVEPWKLGAHLSMLGHGAVSIAWLFLALDFGTVTVEPVALILLGFAAFRHGRRPVGLALLVAYVPFQLWAVRLVTSVPVLLLMTLGCLLVARVFLPQLTERFIALWRVAAVAAGLLFAGSESFALAGCVALVGTLFGKIPHRSLLLVLAHALVWSEGSAAAGFFPLALAEASVTAFPWAAFLVTAWIFLVELTTAARALKAWTMVLESFLVFGFLALAIPVGLFGDWDYGLLLGLAGAWAVRHAVYGYRRESSGHAAAMQMWAGLSVLIGFYAGWVSFGNGRASYVLIASGIVQYGFGLLFERYELERGRGQAPLARSAFEASRALLVFGGLVAFARIQEVPLFLTSLGFLLFSSRKHGRVAASVLSAVFLGFGLLAVAWGRGVGVEFEALAPGFTLVALSLLLSEEMGPRWARHLFTAGATFIYATPVLALYDEITWAWQAVLLLLTVSFGTASFWLRSRPLLTVSTAALVIDLACFVIKIRATEPLLLWVGGLALGVLLMALAAYLEYRREGLAQRIRVFGRELAHWY